MSRNNLLTIVLNFNNTDYTIQCINSLKRSKYKTDILVIDNNSDESIDKIKNIQDIHLIVNDLNLGFSGGNNVGIRYAITNKYKYIMLLNNDTIVDENMISIMMNYISDMNVVLPTIYYYDEPNTIWYQGGYISKITGRTNHVHMGHHENPLMKLDSIHTKFATGCCILMTTNLISKVGLLNEKFFLYYEDTEFSIRLIENNINIIVASKAKLYHKESASTGKKSNLSNYYLTRNRLYLTKNNSYYYPAAYWITLFVTKAKILINKFKNNSSYKAFEEGISDIKNLKMGKTDRKL